MIDLTIIVAVFVVASLCTWTLMRAARIADDADEKEAERLQMSMHAFRFPSRTVRVEAAREEES